MISINFKFNRGIEELSKRFLYVVDFRVYDSESMGGINIGSLVRLPIIGYVTKSRAQQRHRALKINTLKRYLRHVYGLIIQD